MFTRLLLLPAALSLLLIAANGSTAFAQTAENETLDRAARVLFNEGRDAFEAGNYELAHERFVQAYELSNRSALLFNIAVALDRMRNDEEALDFFRRFVAASPDHADAPEARARITAIERSVQERQAQQQAQQEAEQRAEQERLAREQAEREAQEARDAANNAITPVEPSEPSEVSGGGLPPVVFIALAGATAVSAGLLVWSGLDTLGTNEDYEDYAQSPGATFEEARDQYDDVVGAQTRTNILMGATIVLGAAAVTTAILTDWGGSDEDEDSLTIVPAIGPTAIGVSAGGTF